MTKYLKLLFTFTLTLFCVACSSIPTETVISHTPNMDQPPSWINEVGKKDGKFKVVGFIEDHGENVRASAVERMAERDAMSKLSEAVETRISTLTETFDTTKSIDSKTALQAVSKNVLRGSVISNKYWQRVQLPDERTITRAWAQLSIDETRFKKLMVEALERSEEAKAKNNEQQEKSFFEKAERIWNELN